MELQPDQIAELREKIQHGQKPPPGPRTKVRLIGGPLDGMAITIAAHDAKSLYLGWCVAADTGLAQVLYRNADGGRWTFHEIVAPGGRAR